MTVCVFSDSHGYADNMVRVLAEEDPDVMIFLGDGEVDVRRVERQFPELAILRVRGNCDMRSSAPEILKTELAGKKFYITHGHLHEVKTDSTLMRLRYAALEADADMVLFGHTHLPYKEKSLGIEILNPGPIGYVEYPSYGLIRIEDGEIVTEIKRA